MAAEPESRDPGARIRVERKQGGRERERPPKPSPWEWVIAGVSALLILAAIGFMLYDGLAQPSTPPRLEVTVDRVAAVQGGYLVEISAHNRGQSTAAGVVVQGELQSDTGTVETAQITLDYVPAQSTRRAGLIFAHDPRRFALDVRPKGYDRP